MVFPVKKKKQALLIVALDKKITTVPRWWWQLVSIHIFTHNGSSRVDIIQNNGLNNIACCLNGIATAWVSTQPFGCTSISAIFYVSTVRQGVCSEAWNSLLAIHGNERSIATNVRVLRLQCSDIITLSIFTKIFIIDTPKLAHEGDISNVLCEFNLWFIICFSHRSDDWNIMFCLTASY